MNSISKNIIFYITIVEHKEKDHSFLRKVVHSVLPQAIVESVYSDEEAIRYFSNCITVPHLIFLDQDMQNASGTNIIDLIKRVVDLNKTPLIFLTGETTKSQRTDLNTLNVNNFYAKPYRAQDLVNIVSSLNSKWLA